MPKYNPHFSSEVDINDRDGACFLVWNHLSRLDHAFVMQAAYPRPINIVAGYNEFFRFPTSWLLPKMQVIPKKNFTPDAHALRQILRVIAAGGNICLMPEGMSSITGMAQPVIPGGAKLLKKLGVPVYYSKISGGYLNRTNTRYLQNCRYLRLKNLTVGYTVPQKWTRKAGIEKIRVYFSGENLACWSPLFKHSSFLDPEAIMHDDSEATGRSFYPWQKSFMFGLDIQF